MSQNRTSTDIGGTSSTGTTGGSQSGSDQSASRTSTGTGAGSAAGTATGFAQTAQEKLTDAASHAKEFVSDKVAVVGEKLKDLQNADIGQVAEDAKEYARKNPGQAILISAAAGLLLGLILRGRR